MKLLPKSFFLCVILSFSVLAVIAQKETIVKGVVQDIHQNPIDNVVVVCESNNSTTFTSEQGLFTLKIPAKQSVSVLFRRVSYRDTIVNVWLTGENDSLWHITMIPEGKMLESVSITDSYKDSYTHIDPKLSFKMPSPTGGVEALLKSMPGTSSTNELSNQYNVRGGNYDENLIFVNDIQIYRPFLVRSAQQEGLSFVNLDLTDNVTFSAGGFEAKYGDKMASVLDVEYKRPTRYMGGFTLSFLGASVYAGGNVKDKFTFLVGARYKTNSYLLKSMETKGTYKPNFFDTQILLTWKLAPKWRLELLGNLSRNQYKFIPEDRETNFGTLSNARRLTVYFDGQEVDKYENYVGGLSLFFEPNKKDLYKLIVSSYYAREIETYDLQSQYWLSDIEADLGNSGSSMTAVTDTRGVGTYLEHARNKLTALVTSVDFRGRHMLPRNKFEWGIKAQNEIITNRIREWNLKDSSGYTLPFIYTEPGETVAQDDEARMLNVNTFYTSKNTLNTWRVTGFVQTTWSIDAKERFLLNAGLRFHYWTFNNECKVSPRFILTYHPLWKKDWIFRLKLGSYYQPAFYREMQRKDGTLNRNIKSQHSSQVAISSDYNFKIWNRPFKLTMEAYYKHLTNLISYSVDNVKIVYSGENDAKGYATGFDIKLSGEFIHGIESWVSLSLMKTSENLINDFYYDKTGKRVEPGWIPRPTDQRFAINFFFQDHIPFYPPLRVHINFVFASGLPYGAPNTERYKQTLRSTWYRRVDIGFSYMFLEQSRDKMKHKSKFLRSIQNAGLFFEVFNILNINNVSSYLWITDINNTMTAVPNYLSPRLLNLKLSVEF